MAGAGAEVQEERLLVVDRAQVGQVLNGPVGQVGAEVVAVLDGSRRSDGVVVVVEGRDELVRFAAVKPVPAIESAGQRPRRARRRHVRLVFGAQVPLADGVGGVPVRSQDLRQEAVLARRPAPVPREARGQVGNAAHAAAVMVPARDQAGARGRAERRRVEVAEPEAIGGQGVDLWRVDVGAVAAELREAHVVEHDDDDVRRAVRWRRDRGPPRLRVAPVVADLPVKLHFFLTTHNPRRSGRTYQIGCTDPETAAAHGTAGQSGFAARAGETGALAEGPVRAVLSSGASRSRRRARPWTRRPASRGRARGRVRDDGPRPPRCR